MNDENRRDDDTRPLGDELFDPPPRRTPSRLSSRNAGKRPGRTRRSRSPP